MKIYNEKSMQEGTATVLVIHTFIGTLSDLAKHNYKSKLAEAGLETNQVCYLSLFDQKPSKVGVAELRLAMLELEELLKVSNINVIIDCTSSYDEKLKKYSSGLIFSKIFGKDVSLWNSRGVFVHKGDAGSFKWLCGFRSESAGREAGKRQVVDSEFVVDFDKANIITITDGLEAKEVFRKLYAENEEIYYDTETNGLRFEHIDARLLTIQFCGNSDPYTSYVMVYDHKDLPTTNNMKKVVSQGTKWLLESGKKAFAQNQNFDNTWIKRCVVPDLDFYKINNYDTMIIYHALTNCPTQVPLGLKESAFTLGVSSDWEAMLELTKKEICKRDNLKLDEFSYEMFPVDMLTTYAGLDVTVLYFYWQKLKELNEAHPARVEIDIIEKTWVGNWQNIMQTLQWSIWYGVPFDVKECERQLEAQTKLSEEYIDKLASDENVLKTEAIINSLNYKKAIEVYNKKVEESLEKGKVFKGAKPELSLGKYGSISFDTKFNSSSLAHKKILFFNILKLPVLNKTATGADAVGSADIEVWAEKFPNITTLKYFNLIAKIDKEVSTYLAPWIELSKTSFDGNLRSNFTPTASSFRLRSRSPNLLNISKTDIKKCIACNNGDKVYGSDFVALEVATMLLRHQDPLRLELKAKNIDDEHCINSIIIDKALGRGELDKYSMTNPDDLKEIKSKFPHRRQEAKALTFGMAYGQSVMGIAMTFGVSKEVATSIYDTYWASYKGEREFYLKSVDDMVNKGYQINYGNSVILTTEITDDETDKENMSKVRTVYNSIGQSSAHQTLKAMDKAWRRFIKEGIHFRPFLSIYDSIIYSCKDEDAFYIRNVLEEFMLEDLLPDQLFKLSTEFEVGSSYKASHKFGGNEEDCKNTLKELSKY